MSQLAGLLATFAERLVIDETRLAGGYDFELTFSDPSNTSAPWIGTLLEDQLGLKLAATERPVEFLVIDEVHPPTPD